MFDNKILFEALTFDDVILVPRYSEILPSEVSIKTKLSKNVDLNIPIVSSAMDTVTESRLAIAIAREGGIGIIHKNMSVQDQAKEVDIVKRSEAGMITDPVVLNENATLKDADNLCARYKISGLPVVDKNNILLGIITNRDLKYRKIDDTPVVDIMTKKDLITSNVDVSLQEAKEILLKNRIEKLPIVDDEFCLKGLITIKDIDNLTSYPNACKDKEGRLKVGAAVGVSADLEERVKALVESNVDVISIDSAHGHSKGVIDALRYIKANYDIDVIAGNIVTLDAAKDLIDAGADGLKVGVGPGSICTTRVVSGVGTPQISAVMEVAKYATEKGVPVIADGGIKYSGDIPKAIVAGASSVMIGSLLAGTKESPGEEIIYNGRRFKTYYGMGSLKAMAKGSKDRYFQSNTSEAKKLVPEGIEARVAYKGELADLIYQLCGGLRSGMGYLGCSDIELLKKEGKFVKISSAGLRESHPHDVDITKEAPNYSR